MREMLQRLVDDETGVIVSAEIVLIVTILVLGLIVGLTALQAAIVEEFRDLGYAFNSLNQSFMYTGFRGCLKPFGRTAWTSGSAFYDLNRAFCGVWPTGATIGVGGSVFWVRVRWIRGRRGRLQRRWRGSVVGDQGVPSSRHAPAHPRVPDG